jgi:hypothetical protein
MLYNGSLRLHEARERPNRSGWRSKLTPPALLVTERHRRIKRSQHSAHDWRSGHSWRCKETYRGRKGPEGRAASAKRGVARRRVQCAGLHPTMLSVLPMVVGNAVTR